MQDGPMSSLEGGYSGSWRPSWSHFPAFQGLDVIKILLMYRKYRWG